MASFDNILKDYQSKKRKVQSADEMTSETSTVDRNPAGLRIPSFYIIGAQKAGTMAAVKNLNKHPDVFVANEVHYFDRAWHDKDLKWYAAQFPVSKKLLGEKTPELIYVDECASRMHEVSPNAKFLLFLRDPVARAYSAWNMNYKNGRESASFDECVLRNLQNLEEIRSYGTGEYHYVQRGFYMDQIERFMRVFPDRSRLHVVIAERARKDPVAAYEEIFSFLGVRPFEFVPEEDHIGSYEADLSDKVAERLRKVFAPHNERLFSFLGYRVQEWKGRATVGVSIRANSHSADSTQKLNTAPGTLPANMIHQPAKITEVGNIFTLKSADFSTIGRRHGTDKVTHHGYHRFYPRFLEQYRSLPPGAGMLEIGIDQSHSLHTWLEYFPSAFIYGVDISVSKEGHRFQIFKADQSKSEEMQKIIEKEVQHPLFLVLDDGSHIPEHQVACFDLIFRSKALLPGGTYIVEDIETSYWTRNGLYGYNTRYGYHHERSAMEVFKDVLDDVNMEFLTEQNRRAQEKRVGCDISAQTRQLISTVTFGQNCIVITKKTEEEQQYDGRRYRFQNNL